VVSGRIDFDRTADLMARRQRPLLDPGKLGSWIHSWQTLIAASIALGAAAIAWHNTSRANRQAAELEEHRRAQKHASLRSVMPLALAEITEYAIACVELLGEWHSNCVGPRLPHMTVPRPKVPAIPTDGIEALAEFIEYADEVNIRILESSISRIQILAARIRSVADLIERRRTGTTVTTLNVEAYIIDAGIIYAGVASAYDYSRQRRSDLPATLSWDDVRKALNVLDDQHRYPNIYVTMSRAEATKPDATVW